MIAIPAFADAQPRAAEEFSFVERSSGMEKLLLEIVSVENLKPKFRRKGNS